MDRVEARVRAIERLRDRGAVDPIAITNLIEAKVAKTPEEIIEIADTCDVTAFEGLADNEPAIRGTRGTYDGRDEEAALLARAKLVPTYTPEVEIGGGDDDVRFIGNLK
jgi:fructose-bisphosphate aldolase class 1